MGREELVAALDETIALLRAQGHDGRADWLAERRDRIAMPGDPEDVPRARAEVRTILAGMGSLTDLPFPQAWTLAERLDRLTTGSEPS
jgi:hypothetical protein